MYAFKSIIKSFLIVSGIIVNLHNTQNDYMHNFHACYALLLISIQAFMQASDVSGQCCEIARGYTTTVKRYSMKFPLYILNLF